MGGKEEIEGREDDREGEPKEPNWGREGGAKGEGEEEREGEGAGEEEREGEREGVGEGEERGEAGAKRKPWAPADITIARVSSGIGEENRERGRES